MGNTGNADQCTPFEFRVLRNGTTGTLTDPQSAISIGHAATMDDARNAAETIMIHYGEGEASGLIIGTSPDGTQVSLYGSIQPDKITWTRL